MSFDLRHSQNTFCKGMIDLIYGSSEQPVNIQTSPAWQTKPSSSFLGHNRKPHSIYLQQTSPLQTWRRKGSVEPTTCYMTCFYLNYGLLSLMYTD